MDNGHILALTGAELDAALARAQNISNPNLLDNWYFGNPVNQRGQAEYINDGWMAKYCIDRWYTNVAAWDVENHTLETTAAYGRIVQYVDETELVGKTVTFSVLVRSLTGGNMLIFAGPGDYGQVTVPNGFSGVVSTTVTVKDPGTSLASFSICLDTAGANAVIEAAKLELGSQQTLAHQDENGNWVLNEIPNYNEELLKCIQSTADGSDTYANKIVLHTGNKPSGSYTGNGNAISRTISVGGIGAALLIQGNGVSSIVTANGAFILMSGSVSALTSANIKFVNGVLTIATNHGGLNANGATYNYQVL